MTNELSPAYSRTALIIGATSSLGYALAQELADCGYRLILAGRDEEELESLSSDVTIRHHATAQTLYADLLSHNFSAEKLLDAAGSFDTLIWLAGAMGDETAEQLTETLALNYTIPAEILLLAAKRLELLQRGLIVVVSSVAGDRGRGSNFIYGSAKAGLTAFASGLRNKFAKSRVHVLTVKPGFIDTPMTWGMKSPLMASRERVASDIAKAMEKRRDVIYTPWFWRFIMLIIQHIPERVFKRLRL